MALRFLRRTSRSKSKGKRRDSSATRSDQRPPGPKPTPSQEESVRQARRYGESLNKDATAQHVAQVEPPSQDPVRELPPDRQQPVLSDEEERFLERLVSEEDDDQQSTGSTKSKTGHEASDETPGADRTDKPQPANRQSWFSLPQGYSLGSWMPSLSTRRKSADGLPVPATTPKDRPLNRKGPAPAPELDSVANTSESRAAGPESTPQQQQQDRQDVTALLHRLHLDTDALSHRAVSLSADSKRLLSDFCQLVRDALSGAPHAYDDLEAFFRTRQAEIEALHASLPPFLQTFVAGLPATLMSKYAPDLAAAAGMGGKGKSTKSGKRADATPTPPLRSLLGQRGAIASLLRSSIAFLETRFPILLGWSNVLVSLALFVLLFVFWYCWQRGRDERIAKEEVERFVEQAGSVPLDAGEVEAGLAAGDAESAGDDVEAVSVDKAGPPHAKS